MTQVCQVGRGDTLEGEPGGVAGSGSGEPTVESLLNALAALPAGTSAVEALGPSIGRLDSRAVAALLKETAKAGQTPRAVELFDWLRAQPEGSGLTKLCNVFTYTTMIRHRHPPASISGPCLPSRAAKGKLCADRLISCHAMQLFAFACYCRRLTNPP